MPNKVKSALNQLVQSDFTAAEVNGALRVFIAVSLQNLASQRVVVTGLVWGTFFNTVADRPNCVLKIFIQRGITVTSDSVITSLENSDEAVFNILPDGAKDDLNGVWNFIPGIILDPGYNYAIVMEIIPRA